MIQTYDQIISHRLYVVANSRSTWEPSHLMLCFGFEMWGWDHVFQLWSIHKATHTFITCFLISSYFSSFPSILVNMDDRMVEQFVDEDDFIIKIDFDNQLGHFELTLFYWWLLKSAWESCSKSDNLKLRPISTRFSYGYKNALESFFYCQQDKTDLMPIYRKLYWVETDLYNYK